MNVNDFISTLETHPQKSLSFKFEEEFQVLPFIHITELKNVVIESIDCGGKKNKWNETVIQLWTGANEDDGHRVDSSKALDIVTKVNQVGPLDFSSELLVEYGDNEHVVAQYQLGLNKITNDAIYFELTGSLSQCKAVTGTDGCCSASSECCS